MSKYIEALNELNYMLADNDNFYSVEEKQTTYNVIQEAIAKAEKYEEALKRIDELEKSKKMMQEHIDNLVENIQNRIRENKVLVDGVKALNNYCFYSGVEANIDLIEIHLLNYEYEEEPNDYAKIKAMLECVENE